MNNIFSFQRFGLLMKKTFYEKGFVMGGAIILLIVLMLVSYSSLETIRESSFAQNLCFALGFFSPSVLVSILLNNFSKKSSTVAFLTLPCSHFEKWLSIFIIICVIYLSLFLLIFKIVDTIFLNHYRDIAIGKLSYTAKRLEQDLPYLKYTFGNNNNRVPFAAFLAFFMGVGAISMIGSLYFNQKSFLKTALVMLLFFVGFSFIGNNLFEIIIGGKANINLLDFSRVSVTNMNKSQFLVIAPDIIQKLVRFFMFIFIPVALWLIGLVRFADKEL